MWKSVKSLTRLPQLRCLVTSSSNNAFKKDSSFSDINYVKRKQWNSDDSSPKSYRIRDEGYNANTRNRDSYSSETEGRNHSFDSDRSESRRNFGREENANLVTIGQPGKWKVGAGFIKEADRLRNKARSYRDFNKIVKPKSNEPGIRRQFKALERNDDLHQMTTEEELDEEVDVMKFDKLYDDTKEKKATVDELVKLKMVKRKYFKEPKESTLSWSDKEHIRFLHNTDPQHWTFEMIAEHFKIDFEVAKAVATAKWIPTKSKDSSQSISSPSEAHPIVSTAEDVWFEKQTSTNHSSKKVTWHELRKDMGAKEDKIVNVTNLIDHQPEHIETPDKELILQYLAGELPSKWPNKTSQPEVKADKNDSTFPHSIKKNGFLKPPRSADGEKESTTLTATIDSGEFIQKGDSVYSSDGELIYRVPCLVK